VTSQDHETDVDASPCAPRPGGPLEASDGLKPGAAEFTRSDRDDTNRGQAIEPHRGGMVLAIGVASIATLIPACCCGASLFVSFPLGLYAAIVGHRDLRAIRTGGMDPQGRVITLVGMVLGIVAAAVVAIMVMFYAVIMGITLMS